VVDYKFHLNVLEGKLKGEHEIDGNPVRRFSEVEKWAKNIVQPSLDEVEGKIDEPNEKHQQLTKCSLM
jgi:hypothetical protein